MQPTPEAEAFIARIDALPTGPGINLGDALQPSLTEEEELRQLFATDRPSTRLANPHVGLVDVFAAPASIKTTRARVVQNPEELSAQYVMPIPESLRRKEGAPCMVADLDEFRKNWAIFTEGSLSQLLNWNNVVAAGGSVLACLNPLEAANKISKRAIRKHYHSNAYPTSDVDLFLWGLDTKQACTSFPMGFSGTHCVTGRGQNPVNLRSRAGFCSMGRNLHPYQTYCVNPL